MHAAATPGAGELHPTQDADSQTLSLGNRLIEAVKGVVIGERDHVEANPLGFAHQLSWRVSPVGDQRVRMQVNPHTSQLSGKQTADNSQTVRHPS